MMNILDILNLSAEHLEKKGVSEPRLSSELIVSHILDIERIDIYLQFDRILAKHEVDGIRKLLKRRSGHEPVQYILGEVEFYGLPFKVDPSVLIPRCDTEILVETAAGYIGHRDLKVLEIGTGSGCIAISLAHSCRNVSITATDILKVILKTASGNAGLNKVKDKIKFLEQDILKTLPDGHYDVIISNPPYIKKEIIATLDKQVKDFEPVNALTDNTDGLTFYKRFRDIIPKILNPAGAAFFEIGYDQAGPVLEIYEGVFEKYEIIKDLSGNDRVFLGKGLK